MTDKPSPASDCEAQLRALASGDYADFHGLSDRCTRGHAEAALGMPAGGERAGALGGSPTAYRSHPASAGAPHGVLVWHVGDRVVFVRIHDAVPSAPIADMLGEPELIMRSRMRRSLEQHVYASRGLTLHVHRGTGELGFVMGYEPMTADAYRASWISKTEMRREPLRRR